MKNFYEIIYNKQSYLLNNKFEGIIIRSLLNFSNININSKFWDVFLIIKLRK